MPFTSRPFTAAKTRTTGLILKRSRICCAPTSSRPPTFIPPPNARCAPCCANAFTTSGAAPICWPASNPINWPTTGQPCARPVPISDPWEKQLLAHEDHPLRQLALQNDLAMIRHYDTQITALQEALHRLTQQTAPRDYALLQTVPGIGEHLGLTLLYEIGDIARFPTVKDFVSYCRLVKGTVASAGRIKGLRGAKLGNPYLRWAFGEAAIIAKRDHAVLGPLAQCLEARMNGNKFKANTVLAIKLARSVYFMLRRHTVFDPDRLVAALARH